MAAPNQTPAPQAGSSSSRPTASTTSQLVIPITAPAGGITITQPPQTATSFYKIAANEPVTFGWNLTSVLATPTHITVSAICDNGNTYPVGPTDGVIPGTATEVVWDVFDYQKQNPNKPLAEAGYSLTMWDDRGPNSPPRAGYMQPYSGLKFALYTPQTYTPLGAGQSLILSRCHNKILSCLQAGRALYVAAQEQTQRIQFSSVY